MNDRALRARSPTTGHLPHALPLIGIHPTPYPDRRSKSRIYRELPGAGIRQRL